LLKTLRLSTRSSAQTSEGDPSDALLYAVDMARANVRLISLFSGNARKRVR